ncbi:MmcQ/YjbR family DNA-binding protein [Lysobacter sp. K5869]|uniref:MmcQ/YjbR family DNA-binding protein n=1 Tax=Lysobacter sp. K5869 TaxID=2820808 RepID=UPI001C05F1A0|nr:MmcQ/YjbR family DNA-binding protein [Lysobacter sp. K5869]QWP77351.1 MmcQ/YjbR family DNA-binding protein [Lysobacter sp. K5869]
MPAAHPPVPAAILTRLNAICLGLPEAYEETAWAGVRWMVAKKNFAHAVRIESGWPPAYAEAAATAGPATVVTFRLPVERLATPRFKRAPFFRPVWFANIAGLIVGEDSDWDEIADLIVASYRVLAPKRLALLVDSAGL